MYRKFTNDKRKVALIVDNCPAYPKIDFLKSIELIFWPRNTISKLEPMNYTLFEILLKVFGIPKVGRSYRQRKDLSVFFLF